MYIPTGWYPSALTVTGTRDHYRLWVANAKGMGPGPGLNGSVFLQGSKSDGTLSAIDLPVSPAQVTSWSGQVRANDHLDRVPAAGSCAPAAGVTVSEVLCPPGGGKSPIDHVVYIVTENKTFDQYFGDINLTGGHGLRRRSRPSPSTATRSRRTSTPSPRSTASSDRFFSDAEVSVTGHSFTSGGIATDHNELTWPADYDQGIRGNRTGGDPLRPSLVGPAGGLVQKAEADLQDPKGGYIFEAFKAAGATPPSDTPRQAQHGDLRRAHRGDLREHGRLQGPALEGRRHPVLRHLPGRAVRHRCKRRTARSPTALLPAVPIPAGRVPDHRRLRRPHAARAPSTSSTGPTCRRPPARTSCRASST